VAGSITTVEVRDPMRSLLQCGSGSDQRRPVQSPRLAGKKIAFETRPAHALASRCASERSGRRQAMSHGVAAASERAPTPREHNDGGRSSGKSKRRAIHEYRVGSKPERRRICAQMGTGSRTSGRDARIHRGVPPANPLSAANPSSRHPRSPGQLRAALSTLASSGRRGALRVAKGSPPKTTEERMCPGFLARSIRP